MRYFFSVRKIQPPTPLLSTLPCGKGLTQRMGETWSFNLYTTPCLISTSAIIYNAPSDQPHLWGWDVSSYTIESPCFPSVHWDWVLYTSVSSWKLRNVDFFQLCSISPKLDLILISAHIHIAFLSYGYISPSECVSDIATPIVVYIPLTGTESTF